MKLTALKLGGDKCSDRLGNLQSSAKENYMLTDGDLKKLGSISRNNPRKKDWSAMRLYLQSQVHCCEDKKRIASALLLLNVVPGIHDCLYTKLI